MIQVGLLPVIITDNNVWASGHAVATSHLISSSRKINKGQLDSTRHAPHWLRRIWRLDKKQRSTNSLRWRVNKTWRHLWPFRPWDTAAIHPWIWHSQKGLETSEHMHSSAIHKAPNSSANGPNFGPYEGHHSDKTPRDTVSHHSSYIVQTTRASGTRYLPSFPNWGDDRVDGNSRSTVENVQDTCFVANKSGKSIPIPNPCLQRLWGSHSCTLAEIASRLGKRKHMQCFLVISYNVFESTLTAYTITNMKGTKHERYSKH